MRKKGKKVIIPEGTELMDYLNQGYAICNRCGAVMHLERRSERWMRYLRLPIVRMGN